MAQLYVSTVAAMPLFAAAASAQSVEPTLWGIYGAHSKHDCPVNNREPPPEGLLPLLNNRPMPPMGP